MFTIVLPVHKGFEIQTLIYASKDRYGVPVKRGQGYDVSVKIFRAGIEPTTVTSRVFKLSRVHSYDAIGEARRAGEEHGRSVIDGDVQDQSVADL